MWSTGARKLRGGADWRLRLAAECVKNRYWDSHSELQPGNQAYATSLPWGLAHQEGRAENRAEWGWSRELMRMIYVATQRSLMEYAAPAWTPWISGTNEERLEKTQIRAARPITGAVASTKSEAVLHDVGLERIKERHRQASLITYAKWEGLPGGDLRRAVADNEVPLRTGKRSWRLSYGRLHSNIVRELPKEREESEAPNPWRTGFFWCGRVHQRHEIGSGEKAAGEGDRCPGKDRRDRFRNLCCWISGWR